MAKGDVGSTGYVNQALAALPQNNGGMQGGGMGGSMFGGSGGLAPSFPQMLIQMAMRNMMGGGPMGQLGQNMMDDKTMLRPQVLPRHGLGPNVSEDIPTMKQGMPSQQPKSTARIRTGGLAPSNQLMQRMSGSSRNLMKTAY